MAHAVIDEFEAVEVEIHHAEMPRRFGLRGGQGLDQEGIEAAAVGQAGQGVVEGNMVELRLGMAARADVLHLQDQAGRGRARVGKIAAVQGHPDLRAAVAAPAADFEGEGIDALGMHAREFALQEAQILAQHMVAEGHAHQRIAAAFAEQRGQGRIGLQHAAVEGDQGHADRGVGEGTVKALLAVAQGRKVQGGLFGFALGRFDAAFAHGVVGFLLAQEIVHRGQQHRDHRQRAEQHVDARALHDQVEQGSDQGAAAEGDADRAEARYEFADRKTLVALEREDQGNEERIGDEMHHGHDHGRQQQEAGLGADPREKRTHQRARQEHGQGGHGRAGDAAGPALGGTEGADESFARSGNRGRLRPMHQEQQEDEDLTGDEGIFRARNAHRKEPGDHRQHGACNDLQDHRVRHPCDGPQRADQGQAADHDHPPPVGGGLAVVVGHQRLVQAL